MSEAAEAVTSVAKPSRLRLLRQLKSRSKSGPIASLCPYSLTASVSFQSGMVLKVKIRTEAINRLKRAVRKPIQEMMGDFGDLGISRRSVAAKHCSHRWFCVCGIKLDSLLILVKAFA